MEQNLIDINSMESNKNVQQILQESVKAAEALKIDLNEFDMMTDKLRSKDEYIKDAQNIIDTYNQENIDVIFI